MGRTRSYNAKAFKMNFLGVPIEDGFNDGDFVTIEPSAQAYESVAGADGTVSRARTNDDRVKITITLLQNSKQNFFLNTQYMLDTDTENGAGVGPFFGRDMISGDEFLAPEAWIAQRGTVTRGKGTSTQEWVIEASFCKMIFAPVV